MIEHASITFFGWRLAFVVGAALLVSSEAPAQTRPLTAAQVVEKNVAARGGLEAWRSIHALSFTGKMDAGRTHPEPAGTVDNPARYSPKRHMLDKMRRDASSAPAVIELPYRIELKRPRKVRVELDFAGQTAVQVYDGTAGWYTRPYLGYSTPRPFGADELKLAADQQDLDGLLIDAAAKGNQIAIEGTEPVEGRRAYKLKVTLKNGDVRHVWVDAESFLDVEVDGARQVGTRARKMTTLFRDYRKVDGVMIPFLMETTGEGIKQPEKIVIEKATVNPELPDSRFAKPSVAGAG